MFWNGYCGPADGGWFLHGPFFMMMLFVAAVLIFYIMSGSRKKECAVGGIGTALEILRNRYAAGEIDENEYLVRKDRLDQ